MRKSLCLTDIFFFSTSVAQLSVSFKVSLYHASKPELFSAYFSLLGAIFSSFMFIYAFYVQNNCNPYFALRQPFGSVFMQFVFVAFLMTLQFYFQSYCQCQFHFSTANKKKFVSSERKKTFHEKNVSNISVHLLNCNIKKSKYSYFL